MKLILWPGERQLLPSSQPVIQETFNPLTLLCASPPKQRWLYDGHGPQTLGHPTHSAPQFGQWGWGLCGGCRIALSVNLTVICSPAVFNCEHPLSIVGRLSQLPYHLDGRITVGFIFSKIEVSRCSRFPCYNEKCKWHLWPTVYIHNDLLY